ncbi:hypothetical protein [Rhizobium mesoamericanum]|uniref:hypothetical protein n=1 Tax=Rhizobium mesoamericanum TaxID=1079800 RepID=UPI0035203EAF
MGSRGGTRSSGSCGRRDRLRHCSGRGSPKGPRPALIPPEPLHSGARPGRTGASRDTLEPRCRSSSKTLATLCGVSPTSVSRFVRHVGFNGFREMKVLFQSRLREMVGPTAFSLEL